MLTDIPRKVHFRTQNYLMRKSNASAPLWEALRRIINDEGVYVLADPERAHGALLRCGVSPETADRFCLISRMENFSALLEENHPLSQVELERFLYHAVHTSGLQREAVISIVAELTSALNTAVRVHPRKAGQFAEANFERGSTTLFPIHVYDARFYSLELESLHTRFEYWRTFGQAMPEEDLEHLQFLCTTGIPEAQYYLGYYTLKQSLHETPSVGAPLRDFALGLLRESASAGSSDAAAALGDYYYAEGASLWKSALWDRALACYTGYGMPALNQKRRKAVDKIFRQKVYNARLLWLYTCLYPPLCAVLTWVRPGEPLTAVCCAVYLLLCVLCWVIRRRRPCDGLFVTLCLLGTPILFCIAFLLRAVNAGT